VGKTTLLRPLAKAFEASGYTVTGLALAGIAVNGLRDSLGCEVRTIASFLARAERVKYGGLGPSSVVILDEAGMVDVPTMARLLPIIQKSGAMVRVVGDPWQFSPIGAGGAFRALCERVPPVGPSDHIAAKTAICPINVLVYRIRDRLSLG
jgi:ATP-dependent exoDNAse (exonuclease V) alpha subunit